MQIDHYERIINKSELLYSKDQLGKAIDNMAKAISEKLEAKNPILISVLTGALVVTGQLLIRLNFPLRVDYLHATRYGGKVEASNLEFIVKPRLPLKNQTVLIVDDIIDTGLTLKAIVDYCFQEGAKEVYTAAMIDKKVCRDPEGLLKADFIGLEIPDKFIVGYGLDYEEYLRNLDGIYVMPKEELF